MFWMLTFPWSADEQAKQQRWQWRCPIFGWAINSPVTWAWVTGQVLCWALPSLFWGRHSFGISGHTPPPVIFPCPPSLSSLTSLWWLAQSGSGWEDRRVCVHACVYVCVQVRASALKLDSDVSTPTVWQAKSGSELSEGALIADHGANALRAPPSRWNTKIHEQKITKKKKKNKDRESRTMVAEEVIITLSGGAPWGFRLQGGVEHQKPLQVAKVRRVV